ncbi:MAG: Phosphohydrolase [Acidobacteria bacterium]|nr:Phosphohydrolase [Acidobacteriota bacterium]
MPRRSAGLVVFREAAHGPEVLLVHPGGPFWARRDEGAWSIPKGEVAEGEDALQAARREFEEETGAAAPGGPVFALAPCRQKGGKIVEAWAIAGELDPSTLRSNTFALEWPPRSGRHVQVPEVDRAAWFPLDEARRRILEGQRPLIDELEARLRPDRPR